MWSIKNRRDKYSSIYQCKVSNILINPELAIGIKTTTNTNGDQKQTKEIIKDSVAMQLKTPRINWKMTRRDQAGCPKGKFLG